MTPPSKFEHHGAWPATAARAIVASADKHASAAGAAVLREGGNVVDATIAAAFALCVTQPGMCGLGGGGHLLAHPADGSTLCLDFRECAPRAASRDMFTALAADASLIGWLSAATPGTVSGLAEAHRRMGSMPWARLLEPAVALAQDGHEVTALRARMMTGSDALRRDEESRRILLSMNSNLRQPDLAFTLRRLAENGPEEFYHGETADCLQREMAARGGLITRSDLASYQTAVPTPLVRTFHGYEVMTMPPSSAGGIGLLQTLGMLEHTNYAEDGPGSAKFLHYAAEALRRVFADRAGAIGDPAFTAVPMHLLDPERLLRQAASIDPDQASCSTRNAVADPIREGACTTHVSALDSSGNACALTFTLNGMYGSGVTVPGLGFLLNNNMDNFAVRLGTPNQYGVVQGEVNAIAPGKRPVSSMTPVIACRNGKAEIAAGTPGGPTIVSTMVQVMLYLMRFGLNPQDAINAPRIHHQWLPDKLFAEQMLSPDTVRGLTARGHKVEVKASINDANAITLRDGVLQGATDCRREGIAEGI